MIKKKCMSGKAAVLLGAALLTLLTACQSGSKTAEESGSGTETVSEAAGEESEAEQPQQTEDETETEEARGLFEEFEVEDLDGNPVTQEIFAGYDLTMINIWATYCSICISDMPELAKLRDEYADQGVQVIGLCTDTVDYSGSVSAEQVETAKLLAEDTGADFLHIVPSGEMAQYLLPQLQGVPTTVFVDSEGKQVGGAFIGARDKAEWEEILKEYQEEARNNR